VVMVVVVVVVAAAVPFRDYTHTQHRNIINQTRGFVLLKASIRPYLF
jgi:hypothetical protein